MRLFPQPLRKALLPPSTFAQWKRFIFIHLPILHWLWTYRPRQIIGDLIAGITIGVTHVPQGIGFALLAMLPPVFGLYSSFVPVLLYSILGTSNHISVGEFHFHVLIPFPIPEWFCIPIPRPILIPTIPPQLTGSGSPFQVHFPWLL